MLSSPKQLEIMSISTSPSESLEKGGRGGGAGLKQLFSEAWLNKEDLNSVSPGRIHSSKHPESAFTLLCFFYVHAISFEDIC